MGSPSVFFGYDESAVSLGGTPLPVTNGIGRLTSEGVGNVNTFSWKAFHSYDAIGRTLIYRQYWPGTQGAPGMSRVYDLDGNVTAWNNGAARWFYVGYDGAERAISLMTAPLSGVVDATLVANVTYSATGELFTELGNGSEVRFTYDKRLRPLTYRMAIAQNVFSYLDAWGVTYDLNGNVLNAGDSHYEGYGTYTYDNLNRLQTVNTTLGQGCQYTYDTFGNRTSQAPLTSGNCFNSSNTFNGNRISTPGFQYDAAGNLLYDGNYTYSYDAESRLISVQGQGNTTSYQYNPEGIRTTKLMNGSTTVYGYDDNGRLMWTNYGYGQGKPDDVYFNGRHFGYVVENNDQSLSSITYSSTNWLGTELARFGETQNIVGRFASLPYGDNQAVVAGGDDDTLHFTGKERDTESNLDYFGARYYSSNLARFMSPDWNSDPTAVPYASYANPQSLNLYSLVGNNPLSQRDVDGHASSASAENNWIVICQGEFGTSDCGVQQLQALNDDPDREQQTEKQAQQKAAKALDWFNGNLGFGPSNCAGGDDCANAVAMALSAGYVAVESGGTSEEAFVEKQITTASSKIENIAKDLTQDTLDAAKREVNGGMKVAKPGGGEFDHVDSVQRAINGLNRQARHL